MNQLEHRIAALEKRADAKGEIKIRFRPIIVEPGPNGPVTVGWLDEHGEFREGKPPVEGGG